jgi:hypothetical protein
MAHHFSENIMTVKHPKFGSDRRIRALCLIENAGGAERRIRPTPRIRKENSERRKLFICPFQLQDSVNEIL